LPRFGWQRLRADSAVLLRGRVKTVWRVKAVASDVVSFKLKKKFGSLLLCVLRGGTLF
jgi:hypothetical protein